jgi:hypothetical protein
VFDGGSAEVSRKSMEDKIAIALSRPDGSGVVVWLTEGEALALSSFIQYAVQVPSPQCRGK